MLNYLNIKTNLSLLRRLNQGRRDWPGMKDVMRNEYKILTEKYSSTSIWTKYENTVKINP
jgi:hypothetical protein